MIYIYIYESEWAAATVKRCVVTCPVAQQLAHRWAHSVTHTLKNGKTRSPSVLSLVFRVCTWFRNTFLLDPLGVSSSEGPRTPWKVVWKGIFGSNSGVVSIGTRNHRAISIMACQCHTQRLSIFARSLWAYRFLSASTKSTDPQTKQLFLSVPQLRAQTE